MSAQMPLRVCVVGCGDMGAKHAARWANVPGAKVVAVADIRPERAQALTAAHGLDRSYTDFRPAIRESDCNVVSVCVPTSRHAEVSCFAAEQGRHVLCEKPMALTLAQADAMIETAKRSGVKLGVGFMRQYSPITATLRDWLSAGRLGRPAFYHAADVREIRPKREMHDAQINGGPVLDMGVHLFDIWRTIFASEPVSVSAQGMKLGQARPELAHIADIAYDTAAVSVHFQSGDVGVFVVCWGLPPGATPPGSADRIFGPKGLLEISYGIQQQTLRFLREGGAWETIAEAYVDMYQAEIDHFARCVRDDLDPLAGGNAGKHALQIALAALQAIATPPDPSPEFSI